MIRYFLIPLFTLFLLLSFRTVSFAQSDYMVPYPSAMPGSIFYKLNLIKEEVLKYWYFGDFGQFKYSLRQADKYLVEAKTLFDYKQYLLADSALKKSDKYFENIYPHLLSAKKNGKNITDKETIFRSALEKHIEELVKIRGSVPSVFEWIPENEPPTTLNLWDSLDKSIEIRQKKL